MTQIPDSLAPFSVAVADFDRDGNVDVATVGRSSFRGSVFFGDGGTSFGTPVRILNRDTSSALAAADFDRDGFADLVSFSRYLRRVSIHLSDGQRGFDSPSRYGYFGYGFQSDRRGLGVGDLDGDGAIDIVAVNSFVRTTTALLNRYGSTGSGDDFSLRTEINEDRLFSRRRRLVGEGDLVRVDFRSALGSLNGSPAFLGGQIVTTGDSPGLITGFPEVHLDPTATPPPFILYGPIILPFRGLAPSGIVPPGLEGLSLLLQAFASDGSSRNGIFAASDAHELRFSTLPPPTITSMSPIDPSTGDRVTVFGRDFSRAATVTVGGVHVPVRSASESALRFDFPGGVACPAIVVVTNPDGQSGSIVCSTRTEPGATGA